MPMSPAEKQQKIAGTVLELIQQAQDRYSRAAAPAVALPPGSTMSGVSDEAKALAAEEAADALAGLSKYGDKFAGKAAEILQGLVAP